ncbi:IWS1-like protein [Chlorella sorokiniana]|uniref:IWS1-like protein n=1 Tax=Chlorella sorokiniana TaxID=3076 RepID=A0A2P6U5B2_CHLSO|nr:IWS1-like protein [Chlorella sorokiniana]|eukprot:PRW61505.1 IWS1-like protein [Chlorella sorokiniana]
MSGVDDLFGSDDEEPQQQAQRSASPAPAPKQDMKARLAALAAAKKREREEEAGGAGGKDKGKKSKKHKAEKADGGEKKQRKQKATGTAALVDFGDDEDEEDDEDWQAGGEEGEEGELGGSGDEAAAPRAASKRQQERAEREAARAEREANRIELDENDEAMVMPTDADRDFIDDEGVDADARVDFGDDDEQLAGYEEAEEAGEEEDELERIFSKKKRKDDGASAKDAKETVENLLSWMELAVEEDQKANEEGRPAIHKLKLLPLVEEVLTTKRLHSDLLDAGLLGVLKAWLELMPDGTLPNARIRESVLRLLCQLPVDTALEDRKEQLKRSGLGRVVMFYFKLPDETAGNRRLAKDLVERWSRPILAPSRARELNEEERERILQARQQRQAKAAAQAAQARMAEIDAEDDAAGRPRQPRFGEAGFRFHASIPQAAALDYVKAPSGKFAMPEAKKGGKKGDEHKLTKKLKGMTKGARAGRAAVASVEGRNVTIQH